MVYTRWLGIIGSANKMLQMKAVQASDKVLESACEKKQTFIVC